MRTERLEFPGSRDATLAGRLVLPDEDPRGVAVFAHCFTCGKDVIAASRLSKALARHGFAVLRFDFTGLGGSDGDFANTDFSSNIEDLVAASEALRDRGLPASVLVGHSLGGAAVLAAAERIEGIKAVVTIAAPADTEHVAHLFAGAREEIEESGEAEVSLAGRTFRVRSDFLDDVADQPQAERIANLGAALLVMHSPRDEVVDIDNARRIFDAARHPRSFVALDGADHLLTTADDAEFAANVAAAWLDRYAEGPARASALPAESDDADVVVVAENDDGPYGQDVTIGRHRLVADEPEPIGQDTGPAPYDLVLAGLGACTSMTLRMYAERKGWPLERVAVSLRHSRIHADDCESCETETGFLDHVSRVVEITGDLDDAQRRRLMEIADRCPVHRTLHSEVVVETSEGQV